MFSDIKMVFLSFICYSVIGWILEVLDQLWRQHKFINRGFLIGPYCPVHGIGALLMLKLLKRFSNDYLMLFISAVFICSILEYFTSFILEKLFKARWWDYSDYKFNLNGRICLQNSILFGLAGVLIIKIGQPFIYRVVTSCPTNVLTMTCILILVIFSVDVLVSFNVICSFRSLTNDLLKDSTEEISNKVKNKLMSSSVLIKRLVTAFPSFKNNVIKLKDNIVSVFYFRD